MSSWKSFVALSVLGLLGTGANSSPCKPSTSGTVTSSIFIAGSTQEGVSTAQTETSIIPLTTTVVTSQDSASTTLFVEEFTTTAEPPTTTSICQISNPTNYIRNPSFEDPTPSDEDHVASWTPWNAYFKHKSDGWPARTGDYMATVDLSSPLFDYAGEISQQVTGLTVGSWYRISVYWTATYVENPTWNKRCMIHVSAGNSQASYQDSYVPYTAPGQFSQKSFEFKAQSSETNVKFYVGCDYASFNVDHFILDDFEMVEVCPPARED
ncbi:uncharacterized protein B0J16DRAFT_340001 [Fusarium flagelliforme]|uniref:uncharacterized protein n=1 Tax=Fusarium flagelliforme TaxID=2675880 RepID=UPI001E8DABFC|nr:uncharacterized protein B0J16DRAFT_340001 [Fusarium flagelliforme]KAH7189649.1 hypothetical protein B0J16DRAFT_340001 [Fusarium flagelliforme]